MVAELLTLVDVGDVDLDDRSFQRADAILQCDARVGVGTGVEHNSVVAEAHFLQLVNELAFDVTLIVVNLYLRIISPKSFQIRLHSICPVYSWLASAQKIEIWAINYLYFHNNRFFLLYLQRKITKNIRNEQENNGKYH